MAGLVIHELPNLQQVVYQMHRQREECTEMDCKAPPNLISSEPSKLQLQVETCNSQKHTNRVQPTVPSLREGDHGSRVFIY